MYQLKKFFLILNIMPSHNQTKKFKNQFPSKMKAHYNSVQSLKGFTLIELLVVVAVLALLASIVFSNLGGAREGARISNALSFESQVHSLLGSDLVGWWRFDGNLNDLSGYDNHGTWRNTGGPAPSDKFIDGVPGKGGEALSFDGVGDYVVVPNKLVGNTGTVSFFVKDNLPSAWSNIFTLDTGDNSTASRVEYTLDYNYRWYGSGGFNGGSIIFTHNGLQWDYIVLVFDGVTAKSFKNGVLFYQQSFTGNIPSANSMNIGRRLTSSYWKGSLDDIRIYNRALSTQEIQNLYAQTKDKYLANE